MWLLAAEYRKRRRARAASKIDMAARHHLDKYKRVNRFRVMYVLSHLRGMVLDPLPGVVRKVHGGLSMQFPLSDF